MYPRRCTREVGADCSPTIPVSKYDADKLSSSVNAPRSKLCSGNDNSHIKGRENESIRQRAINR